MKSREVAGGLLVRLERGEDVIETLTSERNIPGGIVSGIGAIRNVELGYFDTAVGDYRRRSISDIVELVNLAGNISHLNSRPFVHLHAAIADSDQRLLGGHLFAGVVAGTAELFTRIIDTRLDRVHDDQTGYNVWDL